MKNQTGQITIIAMALLLVMLGLLTLNFGSFSKSSNKSSPFAGCIDDPTKLSGTWTGPAKLLNTDEDEKDGRFSTEQGSYKLMRVKLPINSEFFTNRKHTALYADNPDKKYAIYYPRKAGTGGINDADVNSKLHPLDEGIIFFVNLDANGKPITVSGQDNLKRGEIYSVTDIYQDLTNSPLTADKLFCAGSEERKAVNSTTPIPSRGFSQEVVFPTQSQSQDKTELQLEYFDFKIDRNSYSRLGGWSFHCKPAIYLYPKEKMTVNVKVKTQGKLTYTDPKYPEAGWEVIVYPDGKIYDQRSTTNNKPYPYLYYESQVPDELIEIPSQGLTVEFNQLESRLNSLLPKLGLNEIQTKDFIDYWSKTLSYSPYYFIGVMSQENINYIEPLEITPKPDYVNRVRLYFKEVQNKSTENYLSPILNLPSPNSTLNAVPSTLKIVEWGGMVKNNPLSNFTCSQ